MLLCNKHDFNHFLADVPNSFALKTPKKPNSIFREYKMAALARNIYVNEDTWKKNTAPQKKCNNKKHKLH